MKIVSTPSELMDKGLWAATCELFGFNEWCVNESLMESDKEIVFTEEQAKEIGLYKGD